MATSMKMSGCMKLIAKMSEADQDALLQRLDQYEADGVPRERAQTMAAQDMLAEIQGERDSLFSLLQEQHPDLFTVSEAPAAAAQMSRARAQTETPEFKRWFGDSKVVDENGEPLVVYHGTSGDITEFDTGRSELGAHFGTADQANALGLRKTNGNVMAAYLSIQNPLRLKDFGGWEPVSVISQLPFQVDDKTFNRIERLPYKDQIAAVQGLIKDQGYDGVVYLNRREGVDVSADDEGDFEQSASDAEFLKKYPAARDSWIALEPTQIKSAIGNSGAFDPANPDVRFSRARSPLGFYSALADSVDGIKTNSAPAQGWKDAIKGLVNKGQVKADEVEWSGVNDWLDLQQGKVTKQQVADYLEQGGVQVDETVLGGDGNTLEARIARLNEKLRGSIYEAQDDGDGGIFFLGDDGTSYDFDSLPTAIRRRLGRADTEARADGLPKYSQYTLPGGENYREVLLTLPMSKVPSYDEITEFAKRWVQEEFDRRGTRFTDDQEKVDAMKDDIWAWNDLWSEAAIKHFGLKDTGRLRPYGYGSSRTTDAKPADMYESKHWDQPNVLAHIRVNDRTDADGKRVLFVEELQSDWGQEGKKSGFNDGPAEAPLVEPGERENLISLMQKRAQDRMVEVGVDAKQARDVANRLGHDMLADASGMREQYDDLIRREMADRNRELQRSRAVPRAPFIGKTEGWLNLALKRVMVMAAEGGYDTVAFVNGEQSADRYDLSKQVSRVTLQREQYAEDSYGPWVLSAEDKGGRSALDKELGKPEDAEEYIGKEVTQRLIEKLNGGNYSELSGLDLKVGGEGMKAFYDTIVPTALKKLLPKVGGGQMGVVGLRTSEPRRPGKPAPKGMEQPGFDVTPAMREKVAEGVPLFSTRRNIYGQPLLANWTMPTDSKLLGLDKDSLIYRLQDKQIDLKRVIEGVTAATGQIDEKWNAYLKEELYHGRTAKATKDFIGDELRPLLQGMDRAGVSMGDFETYLHNRHAEERNIQIAKINPAMPDGGSQIDTADARSYLAGLDPAKRQAMESLAKQVDAITKETRELLVRSGLETRETIDKWEATYGKYVPLIREDLDFSADLSGTGTGQGFSVRGPSSKRATGSKREVVDILANLAMQRERAIVRAEKARVGTALYGLALKNPNPDFWLAVNPDAIKDPQALAQELIAMGLDPLAAKSIAEEPKQPYPDPKTGLVSYRINAQLRGRDNVFAVRINGQDRFLFFNTKDERAARMVSSLKNLDADQLGAVMGGVIAPVTRWFASVNTQYNPIFGAVNLIRDTQGALVNLSTTDIADRKAQVFRGIPGAMAGIYSDLRKERKGGQAQGEWAALWEEFQKAGGQTGFRDMFKTSEDRTKALQAVMDPSSWTDSKLGKVFTAGGALKMPLEAARKYAGAPLFDWLSDYNETLENAVRLSAYKAAKDKGLSTEKAASIAKNLTVNFNRKGQVATQMGALWAFFNAAVQGSARLYDTLTGPAGRKIMAGGLLLGTLQAVSLALMGFDEDEPPEFVKERNLVVPLGESGKYLQLPMPLGLHVIPSTSRIITEWIMSGFKDTTKRVASLANLYLEAFNPVGNAATLIQTLSPTFADPLVALAENKDWQGRPIYKEDRSGTDPTPGYTRARDTATWFSKELAYYLNLIGGTKYTRGVFSPTPDQIDYLFAQAGGGVMREAQKISQALQSNVTGEELPSYKIPLGGRFFGDIKEQSAVQSRFYDNLKKLNEHEREIEGRRKNREGGIQEYLRENPEARLANIADRTEREVQELRRRRREMIEKDRPKESIKMIEAQITRKMQQLNERIEKLEEATVP